VKVLALTLVVLSLLLIPAARAQQRDASAETAIRSVFGPYASQALRVAWCESRMSIWARNGQYLGLFQMGNYARARYGHGNNAWTQARAAYRYFLDSGRTWGPWACKP
jgi:hypothetical protein